MPKNAVQRLNKLNKELKSVISIYDVANKFNSENEKPKTRKERILYQFSNARSKFQEKSGAYNKIRHLSEPGQTGPPRSSYQPQSAEDLHPVEASRLTKKVIKSSAPSSSSIMSTICETDVSSNSNYASKSDAEDYICNGNRIEYYSNNERYDSCNGMISDVPMSPSKTLQTAYKILYRSNYEGGEEPSDNEQLFYESSICGMSEHSENQKQKLHNRSFRNEEEDEFSTKNNFERRDELPKTLPRSRKKTDARKVKTEGNTKTGSTPSKKEKSSHKNSGTVSQFKSFPSAKNSLDPKKDKSTSEILHSINYHSMPQKIQRLAKLRYDSLEHSPWGYLFKLHSPSDEKPMKHGMSIPHIEGEDMEKPKIKDRSLSREKKSTLSEDGKRKESVKTKIAVRNVLKSKGEKKTDTQIIGPRLQKRIQHSDVSGGKEALTTPEQESPEYRTQALCKIIEKSNEKLEKMKMSKDLALDIAKQLKSKYEDIQQSKGELIERLQQVERDNERLNIEMKNANESNFQLELKVKELQNNSKTTVIEQGIKNRELKEENSWLLAKLQEMEKQHKNELMEKERQIECIQREMIKVNRNESKKQENQTDDVQRLTNDKMELLKKIDELHRLLEDRQSRVKFFEKKVYHLEEVIENQNQNLKEKTERLEDTNKELESIRKNSKDLEEQVKIMRINIDNFEQMHRESVQQTVDYEDRVKSNQEKIEKLQVENEKLKTELENEKDSLLIKNKIIEDQQETIKQMRDKSDEVKSIIKRNQSLERIINIEREEKLELQEAVERLQWRKEELKKKIKSLESDLLLAPQEVVQDLQKTQMVLHELENQVQLKQKEWEHHLQSLIREKEQACSVAEFATKKLMQTTNEFQRQSESQKRLHRVLAENLAEKERHLRETAERMNQTKAIESSQSESIETYNWEVDQFNITEDDQFNITAKEEVAHNWFKRRLSFRNFQS